MSDAKILLSWDSQSGLSALTLRYALANVSSGCVNIARYYGSLVLVWSPDWISQTEADAAAKDILSSRPRPKMSDEPLKGNDA